MGVIPVSAAGRRPGPISSDQSGHGEARAQFPIRRRVWVPDSALRDFRDDTKDKPPRPYAIALPTGEDLTQPRCSPAGELSPEGRGTHARYTWRVELTRPWMRVMAPMLAPVFRWNHNGVMRAGAEGLARHLGRRLLAAA